MSSDWAAPPPPAERMEGQSTHADTAGAPPPAYQSELPLSSSPDHALPLPSPPSKACASAVPAEIQLAALNLVPDCAPSGAPPRYVAPMPAFLVPKSGEDFVRIHHGVCPELLFLMYCPLFSCLGCALARSNTLTFYDSTEELRITSYPGHLSCLKQHRVVAYSDIAAVVARRGGGAHFTLDLHLRQRKGNIQLTDMDRRKVLEPYLLGYHRLLFGRENPERYRIPVWADLLDN